MIKKNIIITTGGTGGHIFSGLCIYNYLTLFNNVTWVGVNNRIMDFKLIDKNIYIIDYINIENFRKKSILEKILFPINFINSIIESFKIIKNRNPDIIIGLGGYISVPLCIAGWLKGISILIYEQNSIIGFSNYILYFISKNFLTGYNLKNKKYIYVGNFIRKELIRIKKPKIRLKNRTGLIKILILGGSQGSNFINCNIPLLINKINNIIVWHQTGYNDFNLVYNLYKKNLNKIYLINKFIKNIYNAYNWADLVISRSGALTVNEIFYIGLPAIFIPIKSKDNHQYFNALFLEKIKVAKIFNENINEIDLIYNYIISLDRKKLLYMSIKCNKYFNYNKFNNNIIKKIYMIINNK